MADSFSAAWKGKVKYLYDLMTAVSRLPAGLAFPAVEVTSSDPNTLTDFQKGTFTPVLQFGGASVGITYLHQAGRYTKVGDIVFFTIYIVLTSKGSSVGVADITGLPFTGSASEPGGRYNVGSMEFINIDVAGGYLSVIAFLLLGTNTIRLQEVGDNVADAGITDADFANNSLIGVAGHYFV